MTTSTFNFESDLCRARIKLIRKHLKQSPKTQAEVTRLLKVADATGFAFFRHLRTNQMIHIVDWKKGHVCNMALWAWGTGTDIEIPPFEKKRPRQKRVRAMPEERAAVAQTPRCFKPQPVFRDRSVEMFFGPAYVGLSAELAGMHS